MNIELTIENAIYQYTNAWNQEDPITIKAALYRCWTEDSSYTDPQNPLITGRDALANLIYSSYEPMPGRTFRLLSQVDYHNGSGRFRWELIQPGQEVQEGMDYFEYNGQNQITRIVGFFGAFS
jgi:hypothetical protein